jgi:protoporphyrin/coproporphyrin ferrochelatase
MRYQSPSIETALDELQKLGLSKIIVIPLFPQYASASTGSVYEEVMRLVGKWVFLPEIKFVSSFQNHPKFIECIAQNARKEMAKRDYDYFVFSYHGIPERQITKGDCHNVCKFDGCCQELTAQNQLCYRAQCFDTTRHLVEALNIPEGKYVTSFQSRLGRTPWIKPYTDEIIKDLPKQGIKNVLAFSPSFVSDCLETTIEVGEEYKELFEEYGGQHWQLVESLNDSPLWVDLLKDMAEN